MPELKQRYDRTYAAGRPTSGWDRGERITAREQIKPGDMLIVVCHQFKAENLSRVQPLPDGWSDINHASGFYSVWADNRTGERTGPEFMFTWDFDFVGDNPRLEIYRAIDRRPEDRSKTRIPAEELPSWLSYNRSA